MSHLCRVAVVLWLTALSLVGTTVPASAHTELVWSYPSAGASLPNPPAEVALDASDRVQLEVSQIVVRDALGEIQALDGPRLSRDGTVLTGGLAGGGAWGQWQLVYRLVGEDGHAVTGRIDFAVGEPAVDAAAADKDAGNLALWLLVGGSAVLIGASWYLSWSTTRALRQPGRGPWGTA